MQQHVAAAQDVAKQQEVAAPQLQAGRARLDVVDALRGLAILLVIVYHAGPLHWRLVDYDAHGWIVRHPLGIAGWLQVPFFHFGFVGVHAFFVLSGFCIHLRGARIIAHGARHEPPVPSLRSFFLRRFWRIYPPYWIALALFAAAPHVAHALGWATQAPPPGASDIALHATMLHTFSGKTFFSINPAFWSLATEEQFYLAYPLLALALARWGARRVTVAALALSLAWRAVTLAFVPTTVAHFMDWRVLVHGLFLPRWYDWILGCWLAELCVAANTPLQRSKSWLYPLAALLLVGGMLCRVHAAVDKLGADVLFASGFAALLGALLGRDRAAAPSRILAPLRALGRRAYGVYLVHQPLLDILQWPLAVRGAVTAVACAVFCRVCERPFEERSRRVPR